ncbi:ABC transporter permease [Hazenella sp. IB182357]|uniref:ABC transporter permease n=1 Tax=Polycladospora coralii TaxID=2771432 RepID=A0A926RVY1_9BACL|nr:ABC transporter permease [Polycladospora coralii]MBD1370891.1 ABC transporter permease [Polycladospora coralii]MBS7529830.1 ABC transporter permease [Polycladospora coralii]
MSQYIVRRFLISIPVIILISVILFSLVQLAPGDAFSGQFDPNIDASYYEKMRKDFGFDKPPVEQYFMWASNFIQGDFGISFRHKVEVSEMIGNRIGNTFFLAITAMIITYILAIPIGIFSAERPYSKIDYTITGISFVGLSIPTFYGALIAIYLFSFYLGWFPYSGTETVGNDYTGMAYILDKLHHVLLPAFTLAFLSIAAYTRYIRASVLDAKQQDFVRTAFAKGLDQKVVLRKHVLRNALLPLITLFGLDLGLLVSGAIITESIFSWPGLGRLLYEATINRDYPILMAGYMIIAIFVLIGNLIADILYSVADPRIRYD